MILSDREIDALIRDGRILIDPVPEKQLWTSTAVDLTLDKVLLRWEPKPLPGGGEHPIQPSSPSFNVQRMMEDPHYALRFEIDPIQGTILEPHRFVLGFTQQRLALPHRCRIAARVEGKSSLARLGLGVHVTAPTIHAGFGAQEGQAGVPIQLEIFNLGPFKVRLDPGMRICQIIFEEVREVPSAGYLGQFGAQRAFTVAPSS